MGKVITVKYPDLNSRILNNKKKRKKGSEASIQHKRKLSYSTLTETHQPLVKKPRIDSEKEDVEAEVAPVNINHDTVISSENFLHLQIKDTDSNSDLFSADEIGSSHLTYPFKDFYYHIVEEICLEGLDGITLEAFWKRFLIAVECSFFISDSIKNIIWQIIRENDDFTFYVLPEERGELQLADIKRDKRGTVIDPSALQDIYPVVTVQDSKNRGSCATFTTRVDVSDIIKTLDLKTVINKYGRKLVIMADQNCRNKILLDDEDPLLELQLIEYCVLERIGRSRKSGEATQGHLSTAHAFKIDAGSSFHYQKRLLQNRCIKKQKFYIKLADSDQYRTGNIVHLTRFYRKIKSTQLLIAEKVVNILRSRPNYRMPTCELRRMFPFFEPTLKVIKNQEFRKIVKGDVMYPYRHLYPNATKKEYSRKSDGFEKQVRCFELINPYINVAACWQKNEPEDSDEGDDDDDEVVLGGSKIYNMELFRETYYHIFSKGADGLSLVDLQSLIGVDKNSIRMALKKLLTKKVIFIKKYDSGKQRKLLYYAKCLENSDVRSKEMNAAPSSSKEMNAAPSSSNQKISKFKAKLIEKQRAALAKNPVEDVDEILNIPKEINSSFSKFQTLVTPPQSYIISYLTKKTLNVFQSMEIDDDFVFPKLARYFSIPITFLSCEAINLNRHLDKIKFTPLAHPLHNFKNPLMQHSISNKVTKLILLKAYFGELTITDVISYIDRKKSHMSVETETREECKPSQKLRRTGVVSVNFMGESPKIVHEANEDGMHMVIYKSSLPAQVNLDTTYPQRIDMSKRSLSRCQIILDLVNQKRIQEDLHKLTKHIMNEEIKMGLEEKIDRKSLARILRKLVAEGYVKVFQLTVSNTTLEKTTYFICHPTVTHTEALIDSVIDEWRWKYFCIANDSVKEESEPEPEVIKIDPEDSSVSIFKESDVLESVEELQKMNRPAVNLQVKYMRQIARIYGLKPKCVRMRILHEFFFYLIYEFKGPKEPLKENAVKKLFNSYLIDLSEKDLKTMPPIYCNEISWKMFIPPLPQHKGWGEGWTLLCDIVLRLPVSVFCQIHSIAIKCPELNEVLNHPIKRFYLLKDLSYNIRNVVLFKRKYLSSIYLTLDRLAFCGLLQYGPQKYKVKDQAFLYLNRRASILDTKSSEPAYHKVSDKEYPQYNFYFSTYRDVESYWYNVYVICLNTKLNQKKSGQIVTLIDISARPDFQQALAHKLPEQVSECDNGHIYGDKRGAAGLDSSLWAHLSRNWFYTAKKRTSGSEGLHNEKMERSPHQIEYSNLHHQNASKVNIPKEKQLIGFKPKPNPLSIRTKTSKIFQRLVRKIKPRPKTAKREYYDAVDLKIRNQNGFKTRVKFSANEDNYLLLCMAAEYFLTPKSCRKRLVNYTVIRDVIHRVCPESKNKTSRAIQRRFKILMNKHGYHFEENVTGFMKIGEVGKYFSQLCGRNDKVVLSDDQVTVTFIFLMSYINKYTDEFMSTMQGVNVKKDYLSGTNLEYVENNMVDLQEEVIKYTEPLDESDIKKDILKSVIHSSLTTRNQPDLALQLFKIYQQYPDDLIRNAIIDLKNTQTISNKKFDPKKNRIFWQIPFKLSRVYILFQYATFNSVTAVQTYKTLLAILENELIEVDFSWENIESKKYGQLLLINEVYTFWNDVTMVFDLPQNMVILNPSIRDHEELINELAIRYQIQLKNTLQDNIRESEQEQESHKNEHTDMEVEFLDELKKLTQTSKTKDFDSQFIMDLTEDEPFDLTIGGGSETIDQLRTWVTDCMEEQRGRSPSPQFFQIKEEPAEIGDGEIQQINSDLYVRDQSTVTKGFGNTQVPTLEEIKEGMLKPPTLNEDRTIPYITELSGLLSRETFTELNTDENRLERLKEHFITHYAKLESLVFNELDAFKQHSMVEYLRDSSRNLELWNKMRSDVKVIGVMSDVLEVIEENGGIENDYTVSIQIVEYIKLKGVLGATGSEIKEQFSNINVSFDLADFLQILVNARILLKTGICKVRFVHFKYQFSWLIETFELSVEEEESLKKDKNEEQEEEVLEQKLREQKLINIRVAPWIKINGHLNEEVLRTWLCNILSHCLEYPKISFWKICEKFCHVKPIDIYYLLDVLQELGCVDLFLYDYSSNTLLSQWESPNQRQYTILDDLESVIIEPNSLSMTCLGSFFYHIDKMSV